MRESWIVNLRMAFEGSAALAGQGSIVQGEPGSATPVSGIPMGIPSLLLPDRFIEAAAERGVQRLFLLCADSIEGPVPTGQRDDFVLVAEPAGIWQLWRSGRERLVFVAADRPKTRQLDVPEATKRLEHILLACLDHPVARWRKTAREALAVLDSDSAPRPLYVVPFGVSEAAIRLYHAATRISLSGNGLFDDMAPVSPLDLRYTIAQAVAASTRG